MEYFNFAGWGNAQKIENIENDPNPINKLSQTTKHTKKLGTWSATAICGNDITSSCLYVSALSIMAAGAYAPVALLVVAFVLYLYRKIYAEVGSALPLNGGTYTVLLNTTNKKFAAFAACLTLLSYIATAVISAGEAMHYLHQLWYGLNITYATITLLGFFAFLNILGISESAIVAVVIFLIHITTLSLLAVACILFIMNDTSTLTLNLSNPLPEGIGVVKALFLGFAAAMLGISGFESSANFIEEQAEGVFPKTLRNMWLAVSIFNPLICFLALGLLSQAEVAENQTSLLAEMASRSVWPWLKLIVSIDAVLVLSGAVLTSYVGVTGLVRRMTLDRCMPNILLQQNSWRKTNHWIIISFFILCCAIFLITHGDVTILAGVYTISFLCVMALFSIGNMLLKQKRARLPRNIKASLPAVVIALIAVLIGLSGNLDEENIKIFSIFFIAVGGIVALMFLRLSLLKLGIFVTKSIVDKIYQINSSISTLLKQQIEKINAQKVIYFTKGDDISRLNEAVIYVLENEHTNSLTVVTVYEDEKEIPSKLADELHTIDKIYPQLTVNFLAVKGVFTPELIDKISSRLNVPKNFMFISTPGNEFPHNLTELGGVRLIL